MVFKFAVGLGVLTILLAIAKFFIWTSWNRFQIAWETWAPPLVTDLIGPLYVYPWHMTAFVNACIVIVLFIWADQVWRHQEGRNWPRIHGVVSWTLVVKRVLTLYTSLGLLWIVMLAAKQAGHLKFSWRLFPW